MNNIVCVTDSRGWVQEQRINQLARYIDDFRFELVTADHFAERWNAGEGRDNPVYFCSWRTIRGLENSRRCKFAPEDFRRFMASVTSHYNIGGGLDPVKALPRGADRKEAFDTATEFLRRFRVVTANSRILYDLLSPYVDGLIYAPNGVDTTRFCAAPNKTYDPAGIRIGWVGKLKAAKNFEIIDEVRDSVAAMGFEWRVLAVNKSGPRPGHRFTGLAQWLRRLHLPVLAQRTGASAHQGPLSPLEMPSFYHGIDYYLCTSWHEGTPNPALEAASCGVPVVSTSVGNMPELIRHGENGFFVEPTTECIVGRFRQVRSLDVDRYGAMSANMRKAIEQHWSWEARTGNFVEAFRALVS